MAVHGYSVHDWLFDYKICSLLCLPCMLIKEMVVYGYVICSIEECGALIYNNVDSASKQTRTIEGKSTNRAG